MRKNPYRCGDAVFLKPGVLGGNQPDGPGRIVSVMPEAQGAVRYRVRFQHENFERSIALDEIDVPTSPPTRPGRSESPSPREAGSSWINLNTIKIRK
ncbi:cold-shock protein [Rhizobium sp. BR 250]